MSTMVCCFSVRLTCQADLQGNGIQQAFYQDPNVLYISLHVHEDGNFYPSGPYGDHNHCGGGSGLGRYDTVMVMQIFLS